MKKCIYGALAAALLLMSGIMFGMQANAADALNQSFAKSAQSKLVDKATISYSAQLPKVPSSDDGMLYLYEMQPFEYSISASATPVASASATANPQFTIAYTGTRLYTKLGLAVKVGGQNVLIANPQYISNPELLATHTKARKNRPLKSLASKDFCNLLIQSDSNINGVIRDGYTTVQVISDMTAGTNEGYKNPYARAAAMASDTHPVTPLRYMLNASDVNGINAMTQLLTRCAAESSAENYIIGNEVNVRKWNYMVWQDWDSYVREYAQVFRVAYNAIKSQNANARVFICLDQNWDRNRASSHAEYYEYIDGKDFLDKFNALISREGNIDWGVAQHPYPVPLTYAKFWDMSGCPDGNYMKNQVSSGKMVTFQNLSVLTNYLQRKEMLSPDGKVRHVILSEIGLTNAQGVDVQAAALYASYAAAKANPYVEEIIYLCDYSELQLDCRLSGQSQLVFNSLGTADEATYEAWAKSFIGISNWSQVIK
ncbi:MAG: DUF5722 domain-containing protein [Clostridiales bacterium]|nr:DUF5722 domain-containing protein [Clostridiales bacterium]